jgi:flotillin
MGVLIALIAGGIVVLAVVILGMYGRFYRKAAPNEVMIISGRNNIVTDEDGRRHEVGFRTVTGGGTFVWPVVERVDRFSLELITLDIRTPIVYTAQGVPVVVDAVAQIKVKDDDISIKTAAQQFLSKTQDEMIAISHQALAGHLRGILGSMTVEEIIHQSDALAQRVQDVSAGDLANMGLTVISFTIKEIHDDAGYLEALGKPRIAQVKRDAAIGEAEATRDANIRAAAAHQDGEKARIEAQLRVAEFQRDYEIKAAEYTASINQRKAESDLAYDLQRYKTEQQVKAEEVAVQSVEREKLIDVAEKEIMRKQRELEATVQKPAEAKRYEIEQLAEAEKVRLVRTAEAQAESDRVRGQGQAEGERAVGLAAAEVSRAQGLARAEVTQAEGEAQAAAMEKKADAFKQYNQAAVLQSLIERFPDIAAAVSAPLAKTEKIILIGGSDGHGAGASRITGDVTAILAQLPPVIEALTGVKLEDLLARIPGLTDAGAAPGNGVPAAVIARDDEAGA